jgi:hypothetical protein
MSNNSKQTGSGLTETYEEGKKRRSNITLKSGLKSVLKAKIKFAKIEGESMDCSNVDTWKNKIQNALLNFKDDDYDISDETVQKLGISDTLNKVSLMKKVKGELHDIANKLASQEDNDKCILFSPLTRLPYPHDNYNKAKMNIITALEMGKQEVYKNSYLKDAVRKRKLDTAIIDIAINLLNTGELQAPAEDETAVDSTDATAVATAATTATTVETADAKTDATGGRKSRKGRKSRARKTRRKRGKRSRKYRKR